MSRSFSTWSSKAIPAETEGLLSGKCEERIWPWAQQTELRVETHSENLGMN